MTAPDGRGRHARQRPRRRRGRWLLPAGLTLLAVAAAVGAMALDRAPRAEAVGVGSVPATPVLSARRVPEVIAAPVADRRLTEDLDAWLAGSPANTCLVVDAEGREVYGHNPASPVTGASTEKLLTATGLLLALGPDATFETTAVAARPPASGVVAGDLFLVGGGDAALGTPDWPPNSPGTRLRVVHDIDVLAGAIAAAGVTQVQGSVVGDGSRYDDQRYEASLAPRLIEQDQVGPIGGLMVNDGFSGFSPERSLAVHGSGRRSGGRRGPGPHRAAGGPRRDGGGGAPLRPGPGGIRDGGVDDVAPAVPGRGRHADHERQRDGRSGDQGDRPQDVRPGQLARRCRR